MEIERQLCRLKSGSGARASGSWGGRGEGGRGRRRRMRRGRKNPTQQERKTNTTVSLIKPTGSGHGPFTDQSHWRGMDTAKTWPLTSTVQIDRVDQLSSTLTSSAGPLAKVSGRPRACEQGRKWASKADHVAPAALMRLLHQLLKGPKPASWHSLCSPTVNTQYTSIWPWRACDNAFGWIIWILNIFNRLSDDRHFPCIDRLYQWQWQ